MTRIHPLVKLLFVCLTTWIFFVALFYAASALFSVSHSAANAAFPNPPSELGRTVTPIQSPPGPAP